jgi:hypothetical protein
MQFPQENTTPPEPTAEIPAPRKRTASPETRAKLSLAHKGLKHSLETLAKMSAAHKALSPETRAKLSAAGKGRTVSTETRTKISAAQKGRRFSSETRAKMSAAGKGRTLSLSHREKISAANRRRSPDVYANRRHGFSAEVRAKMSAALRGRKHSPEAVAKMSASKVTHGLSGTKHYGRYIKYRLTPEAFDKMLREQDNRCAVCRREFTDANAPFVDHDHNCCPGTPTCGLCTGGLVHGGCNFAISRLGDDPKTCLMAAIYLKTVRKRFAGNLQSTESIAKFYNAFLQITPGYYGQPLTSAIQ